MVGNKVRYFVDMGLVISFLLVLVTGIIKFPRLLSSFGIMKSELPMNFLTPLHDWSGVILVILVIVHLIFQYDWLISTTKSFFEKK